MKRSDLTRPMLERLPLYLNYLKAVPPDLQTVSATTMSRALGLGEVLVRKDLGMISGSGKPKIGHEVGQLRSQLEKILHFSNTTAAVVIGAGKLGSAIRDYGGFAEYGVHITAAFDNDPQKIGRRSYAAPIYPMEQLKTHCLSHNVRIAILTVPAGQAQSVCEQAIAAGVDAIWNFAPTRLQVPANIRVSNENLATSLAILAMQIPSDNEQ